MTFWNDAPPQLCGSPPGPPPHGASAPAGLSLLETEGVLLSGDLVPAQPGSFLGPLGPPSCCDVRLMLSCIHPGGTLWLSETCFGETSGSGVGRLGFQGSSTPWHSSRALFGVHLSSVSPLPCPHPARLSFVWSQKSGGGGSTSAGPGCKIKDPCWAT